MDKRHERYEVFVSWGGQGSGTIHAFPNKKEAMERVKSLYDRGYGRSTSGQIVMKHVVTNRIEFPIAQKECKASIQFNQIVISSPKEEGES